jgi:hypothetical protein
MQALPATTSLGRNGRAEAAAPFSNTGTII